MGLKDVIDRIVNSQVPEQIPASAVVTFYPNLANPVAIVTDGAANTYGVNSTALLAAGNLNGLWVIGIYATAFSNNTIDYSICVSADATAVAPVTILAETPFWAETTVVADQHSYQQFYRPVYIPPLTILCLAGSSGAAAGDTCTAWAVCVINMEN